jgi:hypothetical protein
MEYDTLYSCRSLQTFRKDLLSPSSGSKSKIRKLATLTPKTGTVSLSATSATPKSLQVLAFQVLSQSDLIILCIKERAGIAQSV